MPIPDNTQRERTARQAAAAALDAAAGLGRGDTDVSASSARSAVRSGTVNTAQAGDIGRPRSTSVDPRTGLRKGASEGQTNPGHFTQYPPERTDANPHTPPFP
jgi:hypothetical protein